MPSLPTDLYLRARAFLREELWKEDLTRLPVPRAAWLGILRVVVHAYDSFVRTQASLRAAGLTLLTLLALVPLLALMSSLARGFGFQERLEDWVRTTVRQAAAEGGADFQQRLGGVLDQMFAFVENTDFQTLGLMGLLVLFYAVIALLTRFEEALNAIWHVTAGRTLLRRVSDYLAVVIMVPVLILAASSLSAFQRLDAIWPDPPRWLAWIYHGGIGFLPLVLAWLAFSALFRLMPNTLVRVLPAIVGGGVAAILWTCLHWAYISFQIGVARANAIYGSFAALPLLLVYMHLSFSVLLLGAEISYGTQNVNRLRSKGPRPLRSFALRRKIGFAVVDAVCRRFHRGEGPWTPDLLVETAGVPVPWVEGIAGELARARILARTDGQQPGYLPARAPETITAGDVLRALMEHEAVEDMGQDPDLISPSVREGLEEADRAMDEVLGSLPFSPRDGTGGSSGGGRPVTGHG